MTTDNAPAVANWQQLLNEALTRPGMMLAAYSHFHNYSFGNQVLAFVQCEQRELELGPINTYPGWQRLNRQVRKGERALMLCQPLTFKNRERQSEADPASFTRFVYKPRWFVMSQTDGEPVEPATSPAWDYRRALAALDITETPFPLTDGNTQGCARRREISISPLAQLPHKTRFHELAHVTLGHTAEANFNDSEAPPRDLREMEAEAVALILCETLELPGGEYARGYIQNWRRGRNEIPERSSQRVFHAAHTILRAGQPPQAEQGEGT